MRARTVVALIAMVGVTSGVAACGSSDDGDAGRESASGSSVSVVASTNVWGDVARQIAGDHAKITSIINDPSADPHSYEADVRVQRELIQARIVIANGGGYDDFVDTMLTAADTKATVLNAVDISGKESAAGEELNEHVWYDFPTVAAVAARVSDALASADPAHASEFEANEKAFTEKLTTLEGTEASIKETAAGAGVAVTEPVPLYLLEACGLTNETPEEFSEAIEEGEGVPPAALADTLALFSDGKVKLLAYNEQTTGVETEKVLDAAKAANVPVVPVTETLPTGKDYVTWMTENLNAVAGALKA
ncbi:metal ABC transporter solute-binding protein, Zn/Mn family [Parafrankia sp. BMG5.11]|uniref:metal ABC transporter solute-binding protein, Zn/Mn family n=1 Tax=Parafrankia sp. BMG5.11 TaxID=222540 RepID=UPI00103F79D1|nr:zinc ABC transporter substrate-binding protein [Parafrankia sp. BMG5.11]TCJ34604.1 ABC transporter substrate-binding protein [Parafrankia sp. BMG5.11]